jgi:hypothetical protein
LEKPILTMPDATPTPAAEIDPNDIGAMLAALDKGIDVAKVESAVTTIEEFQAPAPEEAPVPAPTPELAPEIPAAPAPFDPLKELDPSLAKNWRVGEDVRVAAQNAVEQTAFKIRRSAQAEGKTMSLGEAEQEAYRQLGLVVPSTAPAAPAAQPTPEPETPAPASPLEALNAEIKALREEFETLDPVMDDARYREIIALREDKVAALAELRAIKRFEQSLREREEVSAAAQAGEAQFQALANVFEDLKDASTPFHQRFVELHNANVRADAAALADEDYEQKLVAQIAGEFLLKGTPFKMNNAANAPAASPSTRTPQATTSTAPKSTAPAPAPMSALPGGYAPTSEHRVTVQATEPTQVQQQQLSQAIAGGDASDILAALDRNLGGTQPQGMAFFSIEDAN